MSGQMRDKHTSQSRMCGQMRGFSAFSLCLCPLLCV